MIYMIMTGYFEDDASDELTNDPVFKAVLEKSALASQPTVSRFFNRKDEDTLKQFQEISRILRKRIYSIQMPQAVILDLDSTLLAAYGKREGRAFNFHYQSNGNRKVLFGMWSEESGAGEDRFMEMQMRSDCNG
jgi:hypothetical protein